MEPTEIKAVLDEQGKAFEAFKDAHKAELKKMDVVTSDKLARIQTDLDKAVEAKAAIDAALKAETKEREALEIRLNREGLKNDDNGKATLELKTFNDVLASVAVSRNRSFASLDLGGMEAYKAAQSRFLREGKENLSADELKTLSVGSDPDGGYFVTPDLSGRIVLRVYETSPMRQYASVQSITTDALEGIEDLGEAGAGYAGEHATSGDATTPQVGKWRIPVFWIDTEPKATQQLLDDASVDIESWLAGKVADKFSRFENAEFVTGAANKIQGFTAYTTAADSGSGVTWGQIGHVVTGVNGDFAASVKGDKLFDLMGTLKASYLTNAAWFTNRAVVTQIRKFKDGQNNYLWQPSFIAGQPETIMGYPVVRMEDMPALGTGSLSLAFGDMRAAYQIVDRQGVRVMRDPYTAKPYTKFYTTKRTGGAVVNFEAIKLMKFST